VVAAPTAFPVILVGRSLSNAVVSLLAMGVSFLTGYLAFQMPLGIDSPLAFLVGLSLTLIAMTCLGLVLGSAFMFTRNAGQFIQVVNYPIFILSGLTFPLTLLPLWTRPLSNILAPAWGNQAMNMAAGIGAGFLVDNVWVSYAWLVGLSAVYILIARFLFKKIEFMIRETGSMEEW
jgi:ABC-2 type transport system permease protein